MKKFSQKILCFILCLTVIFSAAVTASAYEEIHTGSKKDPYVISDASDLNSLSEAVANGESFENKYFILEDNLEVDYDFAPIGTEETPFAGNFNGNGFEISGLEVADDYAGLFAFTDGATISSVIVSGYFEAYDYAGAVVAYAKNTVIEDCKSAAEIYADNYCGGIVGYIESGKISGCITVSAAYIGGYVEFCGGIAGYSNAEIISCENKGSVSGEMTVGGIAGQSDNAIISCENNVNIFSYSSNLGGIAGAASGVIRYCTNEGTISAAYNGVDNTGGIVGYAEDLEITECYSKGKVAAKGDNAGGIAGYLADSSITNCINIGDVSNTRDYVGGIFGYSENSSVTKCIAAGNVTSSLETKGAVGAVSEGTVEECYYNADSLADALYSGITTAATGLSADQFSSAASFPLLDFKKVWAINEAHSTYPLLLSIPFHTYRNVQNTVADCTLDGIVKDVCIYCKDEAVVITPALGHTYVVTAHQDASCTTDGYTDKYCSVCKYSTTDTVTAFGHADENGDSVCDNCAEKMPGSEDTRTFFQKVADFFRSIFNWFKSLFNWG